MKDIMARLSNREGLDLFETPKKLLNKITDVHKIPLSYKIYDYAAGNGNILKHYSELGYKTKGWDIIERDYLLCAVSDFLNTTHINNSMIKKATSMLGLVDKFYIAMNPPFNKFNEFLEESLKIYVNDSNCMGLYLICFARAWSSKKRKIIYDMYPPSFILAIAERINFVDNNSSNPHNTMVIGWEKENNLIIDMKTKTKVI